jgi:hypothetical protein
VLGGQEEVIVKETPLSAPRPVKKPKPPKTAEVEKTDDDDDDDGDGDSFDKVAGVLAASTSDSPVADVPLPTVQRKEPVPAMVLPPDVSAAASKLLPAIEQA